jgi:hypothetical protein
VQGNGNVVGAEGGRLALAMRAAMRARTGVGAGTGVGTEVGRKRRAESVCFSFASQFRRGTND